MIGNIGIKPSVMLVITIWRLFAYCLHYNGIVRTDALAISKKRRVSEVNKHIDCVESISGRDSELTYWEKTSEAQQRKKPNEMEISWQQSQKHHLLRVPGGFISL